MNAFAFALCLVGLPISFGFTLPKLLLLAMCAFRQAWDGLRLPPRLRLPIAACFAAMTVSLCYSIAPQMSFFGRMDSWTYGILPCALYLTVFCAACVNPPTRRGLGWLAVVLSVHALAQCAGLDPIVPLRLLPAGGRAMSYIGSPVDLGAVLCVVYFYCEWYQVPFVWAGLWAAGSRAGLLAIAFGILARWFPKRARLIAAASLLFFLVPAKAPRDLARRQVWAAAVDVFRAHPVVGSGPDTFLLEFNGQRLAAFREAILAPMATQAQAHNDILQVAATTGVLGLLAYLWLLCELPAAPALVALFAFMKFDPVSLEVLAIAAMVAGMECRPACTCVGGIFFYDCPARHHED